MKCDQQYILNRVKYLRIPGYKYTDEEYIRLLNLARELHLNHELREKLSHEYGNVHAVNIPELISIGKMNAFIGIFHDASLKRYYKIAKIIEQTQRDYQAS